jgi:hypothetical protein
MICILVTTKICYDGGVFGYELFSNTLLVCEMLNYLIVILCLFLCLMLKYEVICFLEVKLPPI